MKKPYLSRIREGVLVFDGAMGTYLFSKGVYLKKCFEEVCLTHPQLVLDVHREYIAAGAQGIETNTYGANPIKLRGFNLGDKTEIINKTAVSLAREAAGDEIYVAASVGPSGGVLVSEGGHLEESEVRESFRAHIGALVRAGVDLILLETFRSRQELSIAIGVAREIAPELPLQVQFTLDRENLEDQEALGREALSWAGFLEAQAVDVVGMNLIGPADALEILKVMKSHLTKPLSVMPDSGYPKEVDGRQFYLTTPEYFAEYSKLILDGGASVLGGCCGTTPSHIEKMASAILSFDKGRRSVHLMASHPQVQEKTSLPLESRSDLGAALARGEWVATVELVPPLGTQTTALVTKAQALRAGGVKFINIPDGPRASARLSALASALAIKNAADVEPILHVCTRDKNLIGLQSDLFGCESLGIRNVLLITGDPPKAGKYPDVTGVFDLDSIGLTKMVKRFNGGVDMGGDELPVQTSFVMGSGVNPVFPVPEQELERAWKKAEAGTEYFITQPVWDPDVLGPFLEKLKKTGVPILLGVWPLASYRNAQFLAQEVPGVTIPGNIMERMRGLDDKEAARQEGILISREILDLFRPLVRGVQVSPPFGNVKTALEVLA